MSGEKLFYVATEPIHANIKTASSGIKKGRSI